MTLFCSQSSGVCCAVLCMSFQKGLKCSSERGEGFSSILSKPEEDWEGKRQAELGFFLLDVMNKVWYAWNGTFARSSILNYWTYWRNSKKKRILASRKQIFFFFQRIHHRMYCFLKWKPWQLQAIWAISSKCFLWWWDGVLCSKTTQKPFRAWPK